MQKEKSLYQWNSAAHDNGSGHLTCKSRLSRQSQGGEDRVHSAQVLQWVFVQWMPHFSKTAFHPKLLLTYFQVSKFRLPVSLVGDAPSLFKKSLFMGSFQLLWNYK